MFYRRAILQRCYSDIIKLTIPHKPDKAEPLLVSSIYFEKKINVQETR